MIQIRIENINDGKIMGVTEDGKICFLDRYKKQPRMVLVPGEVYQAKITGANGRNTLYFVQIIDDGSQREIEQMFTGFEEKASWEASVEEVLLRRRPKYMQALKDRITSSRWVPCNNGYRRRALIGLNGDSYYEEAPYNEEA